MRVFDIMRVFWSTSTWHLYTLGARTGLFNRESQHSIFKSAQINVCIEHARSMNSSFHSFLAHSRLAAIAPNTHLRTFFGVNFQQTHHNIHQDALKLTFCSPRTLFGGQTSKYLLLRTHSEATILDTTAQKHSAKLLITHTYTLATLVHHFLSSAGRIIIGSAEALPILCMRYIR